MSRLCAICIRSAIIKIYATYILHTSIFVSFYVNIVFYIFLALVFGDFLKTFSDCCLGMSIVLHQKQYNMEVVKSDGETMRSLRYNTGTYVVELGVGIGKGGES